MNRNETILNELNEISPILAKISHVNPFTVPEGYFNHVPQTVLACINEELEGESKIDTAGDVPPGYFDQLAENILGKIKRQEETGEQEHSSILNGLQKINPFEVPAGYFEDLAENITNKVAAEEYLPSILVEAGKVNPYQVPGGYFDQLPGRILQSLPATTGAKVVTMPIGRKIFRYAAAAVIAGAVALGGYQLLNKPEGGESVALQLEPGIEQGIKMDDKKFDETLSNLSDEDVLLYLEKNGTEADIAVLANNLDENSLPAEEDYLLDENTLDQFIKDINLKN